MNQKDFSRLDALAKLMAQRDHLVKKKKELLNTLNTETQEEVRLRAQLNKEAHDYQRLEGMSLKKLIALLSKDFDAAKSKEYQEMKIAEYKLEEKHAEIEQLQRAIEHTHQALEQLSHVQPEYEALLKAKLEWASQTHSETIKRFEKDIYTLKRRQKEILEALGALKTLALSLKSAEEGLNSAKNWGIYDVFAGGIISSAVKHDHIDRAASYLKEASKNAAALHRELSDIDLTIEVNLIEIGEFKKMFDVFFDNIFSDMSVQDEIQLAYDQVVSNIASVNLLEEKLNGLLEETQNALSKTMIARDAYVCNL